MKLFKWLPGRQPGVEYKKLCFMHFKVWRYGFDGYILKYPQGMNLPEHTDPLPNGRMWRLNITLRGKALAWVKTPYGFMFFWKMGLFRPDIYSHGVHVYTDTTKLSLGFAKFDRHGKDTQSA